MSYNSRNSFVIEKKNIKTLHYASESIVDLAPEMWYLILYKIKDSKNINIFK